MNIDEKIAILAESAKYDVSCSSSGSDRSSKKGMLGNTALAGICHSWSEDGRCISLLKILQSNACVYDCAYCVNKVSSDFMRATFSPEELADITMNFYRRNYIEGLFLSSAVVKSPDYTMELMLKTVKLLRLEKGFNGYIHLKAIPGADPLIIEEAGRYVDRMSVNMEFPSDEGLKRLAPQKKQMDIVRPMQFIQSKIEENRYGQKRIKRLESSNRATDLSLMSSSQNKYKIEFVPAGQTTQLMIGATQDTDLSIMRLSEAMYQRLQMKRVYYSAFVPIDKKSALLPAKVEKPFLREHRLYQADWLLRFYGFAAKELLTSKAPNFDPLLDPKCNWALKNLHLFPVEINRADYYMLLRIPGVGPTSARRIIQSRKFAALRFEDLKKLGVVMKRAQYFILCKGMRFEMADMEETRLRKHLIGEDPASKKHYLGQLSLESFYPDAFERGAGA